MAGLFFDSYPQMPAVASHIVRGPVRATTDWWQTVVECLANSVSNTHD
jgi:hypothetical protein